MSTYWSGGNKRTAKENGRRRGKEEKSLGIFARVQAYLRWDAWFNVAWIPNTRQNSKKTYHEHNTSWCSSSYPVSI
jgi:hypothetical protein